MSHGRFEKQVRIPVQVRNGCVEFLLDDRMPQLRERAVGDLVFDAGDRSPSLRYSIS